MASDAIDRVGTSLRRSGHWGNLLKNGPLLGGGILLVLALFLRLDSIRNESLECDEVFSYRVAAATTSQTISLAKQDLVHPPVYYLLLKLTLPQVRASPLQIRALSLVASAGSILILVLIGCVVPFLRMPALFATCLLALNKTHIFYSQQARSYSLFCFLVGGLLLWSFLIDRWGHRWPYWFTGCALMILLFYLHYFGGLYSAAVVLSIWFASGRKLGTRAASCLLVAFLTFVPWIWQIVPAYREKAGVSSNLSWLDLPTVYNLKTVYADYLAVPHFHGATTLVLVLEAALIVAALLPGWRNSRGSKLQVQTALALTAFLPPLVIFFVSRSFKLPIFTERHFLPSVLALLLLITQGLWNLASMLPEHRKPALIAGMVGLVVLQAAPLWGEWGQPARQPYDAIARAVERIDPQVPIYSAWSYGISDPVSYYLEGNRHIESLPPDLTTLPAECVVLYRPGMMPQAAVMDSVLSRSDILETKDYRGTQKNWGIRLVRLRRRT